MVTYTDPVLKSVLKFHNTLPRQLKYEFKLDKYTTTQVRIPRGFKVKLGFEFEFLTIGNTIQKYAAKNIYKKNKFSSYRSFGLHTDGSIDFSYNDRRIIRTSYPIEQTKIRHNDLHDNSEPLEYSTPVLDWKDAWKSAIQFVSYLHKIGSFTNESCGLHLNISIWKKKNGKYVNVTRNSNHKIFREFLVDHEDDLLELWDRRNSEWCHPIRNMPISAKNKTLLDFIKDRSVQRGSYYLDKFSTFNIGKLSTQNNKNPYIECRIAGGEYCHLRLAQAYHTIGSFANCLLKSLK